MARNAGILLALKWIQPRPPSNNRVHLPIDTFAHAILYLLGPEGDNPLPVITKPLLLESDQGPPPGGSFSQRKQKCRDLLMEEW